MRAPPGTMARLPGGLKVTTRVARGRHAVRYNVRVVAERVVVQAREGRGACPYCRGDLGPDERLLVCEGCRATFHADCLRGLGRCATLGCGGTRAVPVASRVGPLEAAVPPVEATAAPADAPASPWARHLVLMEASVIAGLGVGVGAHALGLPSPTAAALGVVVAFTALVLAFIVEVRAAPPAPPRPPDRPACPACDRPTASGERVLRCEGCEAEYHSACLRAAGRCGREGCAGRRAVPVRARRG
ncbi:MAG: PHD finger domain-containing protein [Planctomycetes bacterium]|nr:PHD finger domain-containing protein [Planctomycetota bacterium]